MTAFSISCFSIILLMFTTIFLPEIILGIQKGNIIKFPKSKNSPKKKHTQTNQVPILKAS